MNPIVRIGCTMCMDTHWSVYPSGSDLRRLLTPLDQLVVVGLVLAVFCLFVFWFSVFCCFVLLESFPSIFTEDKVLLGWPPHTARAFWSEIIWWNPCVLTPLPHNEALQSKPLSLFLTGVSLAAGGVCLFFLASPPYQWLTSTPNHWA